MKYYERVSLTSGGLIKWMVIWCILLWNSNGDSFSISMSASSVISKATTSHSFEVTLINTTVTVNSYIFLNYSSNWDISSISGRSVNDFCETGCNLNTVSLTKFGQNVRINNLFPIAKNNQNMTLMYTIKNIVNPNRSISEDITIGLFDNTNSLINLNISTVQILSSTMTCTGIPRNTTVYATTIYDFLFVPNLNNPLPNSGFLTASFPPVWSNSAIAGTFTSPTCTPPALCSLINTQTIQITSLFVPATTTTSFSLTIANIINPDTPEHNSDLKFTFSESTGQIISSCNVVISSLIASQIAFPSFSLNELTKEGVLNFSTIVPPLPTDEILLTFPPQLLTSSLTKSFVYYNNDFTSFNTRYISLNSTSNTILLSPFISSTLIPLVFKLYLISAPTSNGTASTFTLSIRRSSYIYSTTTCCQYSRNLDQTLVLAAYAQTKTVSSLSNYLLNLTFTSPKNLLISYFYIHFSSSIFPSNTNYQCAIITLVDSSILNCTSISTSTLKVSLISSSINIIGKYLNFLSLQSNYSLMLYSLTNPSTVSTSMYIQSFDQNNHILQQSNTITINYISTSIANAVISSNNLQVGALSTYTIQINNTNTLQSTVNLYITFPSYISADLVNTIVTINGSLATYLIVNTTYIKVTLTTTLTINSYTLFPWVITLTNIRNPPSLEPTTSFKLALESATIIIETMTSALIITMATPTTFSSFNVIPNTLVTQAITAYSITYSPLINYTQAYPSLPTTNYTIQFGLPVQYTLLQCSACISYCKFAITPSTTNLSISSVINPSQISILSSISLKLYINGYLSISGVFTISSFVANVVSFSLTHSNTIMGSSSTIQCLISNLSTHTKYMVLILPLGFYTGTVSSISSSGEIQILSFSQVSNVINITIFAIHSSTASLLLYGLVNPVTTPSTTWSLQLQSSNAIVIANSVSSVTFIALCGNVCQTCINSTYCLTCYQNVIVNNLPFYHQTANTCLPSCNTLQFLVNKTCYPCALQCLTCQIQPNNCTSCNIGTSLLNNICLVSCPVEYYSSSQTCVLCVNNCLSCQNSTHCLSCISGFILDLNGSCLLSCSVGYYNNSNICAACVANCSQCNINSGCSTCVNSTYLLATPINICVITCPNAYYISTTQCLLCISPCLSCQTLANNCTSCLTNITNKYYLNNQCLTQCPVTFYFNEKLECLTCISPCANCLSATSCQSCLNPLLYYSPTQQCLVTCFVNSIAVGNACIQCSPPCLECSVAVNNCTSCIQGYYLKNNACTLTCIAPLYPINRLCVLCAIPCLTCVPNLPYKCTSCIIGYFFLSPATTCFQVCPQTTFTNANTCLPCSAACYNCTTTSTTCTSCYPGLMLFNFSCISSCPTTPIIYFQYQSQCISCQAPCLSCFSTPLQCTSCINSSIYYWNRYTLQCSVSCTSPYFTKGNTCEQCQMPCKTCSSTYNICSSCYNGKYLDPSTHTCVNACRSNYYADFNNNTCMPCPNSCSTCLSSQQCLTCIQDHLFYDGACYSTCPNQSPFAYHGYCRNCLQNNCLLCDNTKLCVMCQTNYVNQGGTCQSECNSGYELDLLSSSHCIEQPAIALYRYLKQLQVYKVLVLPGTMLLIIFSIISLCWYNHHHSNNNHSLFILVFIVNICSFLSVVEFTYFYTTNADLLPGYYLKLPSYLMLILSSAYLIFNIIHAIASLVIFSNDQYYNQCRTYGANTYRTNILYICSALVGQYIVYIVFSGVGSLPLTCFKLERISKTHKLMIIQIMSVIVVELPILLLAINVSIFQKTYAYNNKLFYSGLDTIVIFSVQVFLEIIFMKMFYSYEFVSPYKKFILQKISNVSICPASQPMQDAILEEDLGLPQMHHSNSQENIPNNQDFHQVQFTSVFDPTDYDQPPKIQLKQVQHALKKGQFRKKNKKKKGKKYMQELDVIDEDSDEQVMNKFSKKKITKNKNKKAGYLNNFIYWKPPTDEIKINPGKIFKQNQREIMKKIHQKQSQFDTIVNNLLTMLRHNMIQYFQMNRNTIKLHQMKNIRKNNWSIQKDNQSQCNTMHILIQIMHKKNIQIDRYHKQKLIHCQNHFYPIQLNILVRRR